MTDGRLVGPSLEAIKEDAWRDSEKWGVGSVRGIEQGILQLRTQALPARRRQLFSENPEVPGQGLQSSSIYSRARVRYFA